MFYTPQNREQEINLKALIYIKSDLYPEGEFLSDSEARLSVWDVGFTNGYTVYDWTRTFKGKPWQLKEHLRRLYRGCKYARLDLQMSKEELERICIELCSRNEHLLRLEEGEEFQ